MNGYIDTIQEESVNFKLGAETIIIFRAKFGDHLALAELREGISSLLRRNMIRDAGIMLRRYFLIAGIKERVIDSLSGKDALLLYLILVTLNSFRIKLPFLKPNEKPIDGTQKELPYDYPGRRWATWVTLLGEVFGWSRQDIFDMYPEEVACYVQEAIVTNYYKAEQLRALSEVSYKYDKVSKTSKFIPTPMPFWMAEGLTSKEKKVRVKRTMIPMGNVVSLCAKSEKPE